MPSNNKLPPAGLHPQLVKKLLDNLEGNDAFRTLFQHSPEQALRSIGYSDPWDCMEMKAGAQLASGAQIRMQRAKLEASLVNVQGQTCPLSVQEGG
ncbi:NHLP-related RiPP peptide [Thermomonas paludicola]|uniref:NHLP-related RiPP peptide n=1 Tax=Thermomonas paludicola TaxID=2884874 RepID=UPI0021159D82|nr:NHLP-related RiPP peptide [Thermomonas paludicola]